MYDTTSVFEAMELDNTQHRVASRRALALAHLRVESHLGSFLRGAQNEDEFFERLALVQDDFAGYVDTASTEVGHSHPEHIAAALRDHYRLAAQPVEFQKTPEEEQKEDEEEAEEGKTSRWAVVAEDKQSAPLGYPEPDPLDQQWDLRDPAFFNQQGQVDTDPLRNQQGYIRSDQGIPKDFSRDEGFENIPHIVNPELQGGAPERQLGDYSRDRALEIGPNVPPMGPEELAQMGPVRQGKTALMPPDSRGMSQGYQDMHEPESGPTEDSAFGAGFNNHPCRNCGAPYDNHGEQEECPAQSHYQAAAENAMVTCPECGGTKLQAGVNKCGKCHGKGKVPNFGDSMVDNVGADVKTSAENQNNTDLGGPEPKMDKRLWTPSAPGEPKVDDGDRWPTKQKDIIEPIVMNNTDKLEEIGEKATEHQTLPTQTDDTPFATGGEDFGPHTDTFGNDGQVDPVTREALSATENPLTPLLLDVFPTDAVVETAFKQY